MNHIDAPKNIRQGEELNISKVETYLKDVLPNLDGDIYIKQFPSGFSNLTYLVTIGQKEFILRRPPIGKKAKTAHDMKREYNILKALKPAFPYAPEPILYSENLEIMGCPFYLMERIKGIILRKNFPDGLILDKKDIKNLCKNLISVFSKLHNLDYHKCGLSDFGKPEGYVNRQVDGWSKRYRDARTDDVPDFERVMAWLKENMPEDNLKSSIIHNDYKFDNVVLNPANPSEIIGVIDWEMATIGDPIMDLGASLAYWVNHDDSEEIKLIRTLPTTTHGMLSRKEMVALYQEISGSKIDSFGFYLCFGLFRLAVIAQQIYYRYYHGQTKDERFKMLGFAVNILEKAALNVIKTGNY
ncbi:MAG: phosphotransferase family protein [Desulfobacterales bacterium]|nr:phosphotransferase family protein [Desulfobacterales bacterium]